MKYLIIFVLAFFTLNFVRDSCSEQYNESVFAATDVYNADMDRCNSSSFPTRCRNEATLYFYRSLDQAGDIFEDCVGLS